MQETIKTKNGYREQVIENNQVTIMGEIVSEFSFSHEIFGEGFYMVSIQVARLSESMDIIPVMISERLLDVNEDYRGMMVVVNGQFRSYNRHEEHKNKLVLSVFAREVEFVEEISENIKTNQIFLDGYVCKEPIYRKTPLGREIADLLLAVNRPYGKSDYIPCICWGRNAPAKTSAISATTAKPSRIGFIPSMTAKPVSASTIPAPRPKVISAVIPFPKT